MTKCISAIEKSMQHPPGKRILFEGELKKRDSLRKPAY